MEELNIQEIEKKLNQEFASGRRIVFWYDSSGAFEDAVTQLKLEEVTIHYLTERNAFRTKLLLEHEDTEHKYLLYAPFAKPEVAGNHLEDTLRYSSEFYADKLSLIAAEIHLPDRLKPVLSTIGPFFGVGVKKSAAIATRVCQFMERSKEIDFLTSGEESIYMLAMCVLTGARNITFDDLIYSVFDCGDLQKQEVIEKFQEFNLDKVFWELCRGRYGYYDPKPSLMKFAMSLFVTYTCKELKDEGAGDKIPKGWEPFLLEKRSNVNVLLDNMMNSVLYQKTFDILSRHISEVLDVKTVLTKIPLEALIYCTSFEQVDYLIIQWMISRELDENQLAAINDKRIPDLCMLRERLHFGTRFRWEYKALTAAYRMLSVVLYKPQKDLPGLIEAYCREDYEIDTAYRNFICAYDQVVDTRPFEKLKDQIENIYFTEYLEKNIYAWNTAYQKNGMHRVIPLQADFYQDHVEKMREKVVVIISDAFRYEVARELFNKLQEDQNCTADLKVMMGTLPTYTALGMAELLPHEKIFVTDDYTVLADGKPCASTAQREKLLQKANLSSAAVDYETVKAMKAGELKQFSASKKVIYIYHDKIDSIGEAFKTEHTVFHACAEAVNNIYSLIKTLSRSGNIYRFFVTADHGFLYTRRGVEASDKLENQSSQDSYLNRRFMIDHNRIEADGVYAVKLGDALSNDDSRYIMLPKGMSVFKAKGGMNYVHGGASAQELLLPCIFVKTQKGVVPTEDVKLVMVTSINKISNLLTAVDFLQEEPVSDVVKGATFRICFEGEDGEVISNEVIYTADSKDDDPRQRMFRLKFDMKRKSYDEEKKYFLKVRKDQSQMECYSRQVFIDLPYSDDFGF